MLVQYFLQKQSIELVFDVVEKANPSSFFDSHLQLLKQLSKYDPKNMELYKAEFEKTADIRMASKDIDLFRENIVGDLLKQTLRNSLIVLLVSLVGSFLIASNIVGLLKRLLDENKTHSSRLERLGSLESWQRVARMLVHELRAPITPIKLVSTDLENKYRILDPQGFKTYLSQGTLLIQTQVAAIEKMTDSFMKFAKLPEVHKVPTSVSGFLRKFVETYQDYRPGMVQLGLDTSKLHVDTVCFDPALLTQVLFNLLKNAAEANRDSPISVQLDARQDHQRTWISFMNTGQLIPKDAAERMFELYVSSKSGDQQSNLGLGLTISKKIVLDHGGDLYLLCNNEKEGVVFELELPNL
jgi:signal transduction histidine kinase